MTNIIMELVNNKLKSLTSLELMNYAHQYNFELTMEQADSIINYFKQYNINPFDKIERKIFFTRLGEITNPDTAKKAHHLFTSLIKKYNLNHLFE